MKLANVAQLLIYQHFLPLSMRFVLLPLALVIAFLSSIVVASEALEAEIAEASSIISSVRPNFDSIFTSQIASVEIPLSVGIS